MYGVYEARLTITGMKPDRSRLVALFMDRQAARVYRQSVTETRRRRLVVARVGAMEMRRPG